MRSAFAPLAFAAVALASPAPQGVTSAISPKSTAPAGCSSTFSGTFEIEVVNVTSTHKRDVEITKRDALVLTLNGGILKDSKSRTGYIAANHQFQFDGPAQTGAIYTAGWSVCGNNSLAIGGNAIFYQCLSGSFYNLYDQSTGEQCTPVYIEAISGSSSGAASAIGDGQVTASPKSAAPVSQITDGQVQASTSAHAVTQISDGQIQAPTKTASPVTQIGDGQIQAPTSKAVSPVTQIGDGQIQAPTSKAVSPVTQISDGQIQAPTSKAVSPVTQIGDGQIQAPTNGAAKATGTGALGNGTSPATATHSPYVGAASVFQASFVLGAGAFALAMLL